MNDKPVFQSIKDSRRTLQTSPPLSQVKFKKYYKAVKEDVPGYDKDQIKAHIPLEQYGSNPSTPSPIQHSIHSNDFSEEFLMETIDCENFQNMYHQYSNGQYINAARQ